MPYSWPDRIPKVAKHWSKGEQHACTLAASSSWNKNQDEKKAVMACIGAAKNHRKKYKTYKQDNKVDQFEKESEKASLSLQKLITLYYAGEIALEEVTDRFQSQLKEHYMKVMLLGRGDVEINEIDLRELNRRLDEQYGYLDGFVKDLRTGRYSQQRALWRAGLYGYPYGAFTYYDTPQDVAELMPVLPGDVCLGGPASCGCALNISYDDEGTAYVDWVLDPIKEHCAVCMAYASETFIFTAEELITGKKK